MKEYTDLLPLAWFGLIVVGVISSVVKSAKRQAANRNASPSQMPAVRVAGVPQGLHAQFAANAAPVAPPAPAPRPVVPPPVRRAFVVPTVSPVATATVPDYIPPLTSYVPAPLDTTAPPHVLGVASRPLRAARLFGSSRAVMRAIIASEVLGKPRALRDEY